MMSKTKGTLIVIEGGDGSGKGTQSGLLQKYLTENKIAFKYVDFPNYSSFYGGMIAQFLRGEYGTLNEVSPYLAALLFALDRKDVQKQIVEDLNNGYIVIANRYVTSNLAHQGSKYDNNEEKELFITWLETLEYDINKMPREDIVIYLKVSWQAAIELTLQKEKRAYLQGKDIDIHEADHDYRKKTESMYDYLAEKKSHWETLPCLENGTMISKEAIHSSIIRILKTHSIL